MYQNTLTLLFALYTVSTFTNAANVRFLESAAHSSACTTPEQNVDYFGNDLANVASATADGCCQKCTDYPGCHAYTFTNLNGGTCWLKSTSGNKTPKQGAISAVVQTRSPDCSFEQDIDYVDNDIGNAPGATPSNCCLICKNTANCRAFTHTSYLGGTCWLKSGRGNVVQKTGAVSSVVGNNPLQCSTLDNGKDYVDNDIGNAPGAKPGDCCTKCATFIGCRAWTWSKYQNGWCWFKSGKGNVLDNPDTVSWNDGTSTIKCSALEVGVDYIDNDIGSVAATSPDKCCDLCKAVANCKAYSFSNYLGGTCWLKSKKDKTVLSTGVTSGTVG